jgi:DNA-binding LacI/PurR family transcriptional regulator
VDTNNLSVGAQAAQALLDYGHRTLALLNPKPDHATMRERVLGFTLAAQQAGAEVLRHEGKPFDDRRFPLHAVERIEEVHGLLESLLHGKTRPTAVFTPADSIAALIYRDLTSREQQVGRDLSLISCNGEASLTAGLFPTLTTFDIHAEQIGRRAVLQLIWRLSDGAQAPRTDVTLAPTLVPGASIIPPSKP